jgi:hypothetical protein
MPFGLRVNCTADASARYSRCRETAAWISRPKNTPTYPITSIAAPANIMRMTICPLLSLPLRRLPLPRE